MRIIRALLVAPLALAAPLLGAQPCSLDSLQWLLGHWVADDGVSITSESWVKVSALTFEGIGQSKSKATNERQHSESLRLIEVASELFYVAKPEQNSLPVSFKLTHCSSKQAVFENPAHDFPQRLEYQLGTTNKMTVTVSGAAGKKFDINFTRRDGN